MEKAPAILRGGAGLERIVNDVHRPVASFLGRYPAIRSALDGSWLGHPLHPALVSFPIGAWATTVVLDIAGSAKNKGRSRAADTALGFGLVAAIPTVAAGLVEFGYLEKGERRNTAFVHASTNAVAASLLLGSLFLRRAGMRSAGVALSMLGFGVAGVGAWLGGTLSYRMRAGVERFESKPQRSFVGHVEAQDTELHEPRV